MFNIGGGELFLILFIVLLLFGPKKIPEFARALGKGMREFKNATDEIKKEIDKSSNEIKKEINDSSKEIKTSLGEIKNITTDQPTDYNI